MFSNKSVQKQVSIFNDTLMNIFSNFTPNKLVKFANRDPHGWMILLKVKLNGKTSSITHMPKIVANSMIIFIFKKQQI